MLAPLPYVGAAAQIVPVDQDVLNMNFNHGTQGQARSGTQVHPTDTGPVVRVDQDGRGS